MEAMGIEHLCSPSRKRVEYDFVGVPERTVQQIGICRVATMRLKILDPPLVLRSFCRQFNELLYPLKIPA